MRTDQMQKYKMLERVYNFAQAYLGKFPKGSAAAAVIAALGAALAQMKNQTSQQVSVTGAIQKSGTSHIEARKALKTQLDLIYQTARALNLEQFYLPRQRTDAAYIAAAQSFAELALPNEQQFVEQGLPVDFIAALSSGIADLQLSAQAQNSSKGAHSSSIAEFNKTLKQAMETLKRFDALVKNTFGNDPGIMAAWKIARHVSQTGTTTKAAAASAGAGSTS